MSGAITFVAAVLALAGSVGGGISDQSHRRVTLPAVGVRGGMCRLDGLGSAQCLARPSRTLRRFRAAPQGFSLESPRRAPAGRADNVRGVYLTANSVRNGKFPETLERLSGIPRPAIAFDVKGGRVFFDSSSPLAREWGTVLPTYDLPKVLADLRERGIYAIARFVAVKDEFLIERKPELSLRHPLNGQLIVNNWIDPAHPEALAYNMEIICELAAAGMDEINLDYVRFSTASPVLLSAIGTEEKIARVEAFVRAARETVDRCGPATRLGISTYAILGWNREINMPTLGQDVVRLAPYVDVISPMAYPATFAEGAYYVPGEHPGPRSYYLVFRTLKGYEEWIGSEEAKKIRPWIQAYSLNAENMAAEIRAVYDAGYCGFQFWSAGNIYEEAYRAMRQTEGQVPVRCV